MNTRTRRCIILVVLSVTLLGSALCMADTGFVTITLPEQVIRKSIESALPLSINPDKGLLEGSLVLDTIDRFELGNNSAMVHGLILGKNLVLTTRIGDQDFRLKLGEMRLPMTCDFTFRFDPQEKNLYITPHLTDSLKEAPPEQANKVLPILAMLSNREYPISFESMKRFQAKIGQRHVSVEMEPVDIQISQTQLVLKMVPRVSKTN